jgi:hypothetical protein
MTSEDLRLAEDGKPPLVPGGKPTNAEDAREVLGEEKVAELHQSVDDMAVTREQAAPAVAKRSRKAQTEAAAT